MAHLASTETTLPYPSHRVADVVLRDGSTVRVRPIRREDEAALLDFYRGLSEESRTLRFFSLAVDLASEVHREADVDYRERYGLVATSGAPGERIVGHALYVDGRDSRAEAAFAVADDYQGRGLGAILLAHLAEAAHANGIHELEAEVLPANTGMLRVFRDSGFPLHTRSSWDSVHVAFPTSHTEDALLRFERREQIAAANALGNFFHPRSVAVIGASRQRGTVGGELFHNLLLAGFEGPVYPLNPATEVVQSVVAYRQVEDVPGPVDLAVVAVPAKHVAAVADACGRKGVRALVVISAGFSEVGEEGRARQAELLRVCRAHGMRLIGPNCLGIVNTDPAVRLNAIFSPLQPPPGRIGFASQSGALGIAAIDYAGTLDLGISTFVSMGNKADISGNDLLNYWESDPSTDVILLYLESFGNPRKFSRVARRVAQRKPIVVVKSGRSSAGARATSSHTGALLAASDVTVDALFEQTGVIRTDTLEELFNVAGLLADQPLPAGPRVAIVTNVGGPAILCADTCEAQGLQVPVLTAETQARLRSFLPPAASVTNPVDMIAAATASQYHQAIATVAADPNVDTVVTIFIPPLATRAGEVADAIAAAVREIALRKPTLAVFMSSGGAPRALRAPDVRVPCFRFPESAAIALAHAVRYARWKGRTFTPPHLDDIRREDAAAVVARALARGGGWLEPAEIVDLFTCYGLPLAPQRTAPDPEGAAAAADEIGGTVVLKGVAPGLVHKSEAGAVQAGLRGAGEVRLAAEAMRHRLVERGFAEPSFLVQQQVARGVEMIVGIVQDPQFGPTIACGAGGVLVEVLGDVSVRLAPLTVEDAHEMVGSLRSAPLLAGFRGSPPADRAALEEVLLRVSALAEDLPQVAELDCNPVVVLERGATIVDARIRITPAQPPRPLGARRD